MELAASLLPERPVEAHKGTFGHLFVLAGSRGFLGSGRMVCEAAMRTGAGLVSWGLPESLADIAMAFLVEAMCRPLPSTAAGALSMEGLEEALGFAEDKDAGVIGPGLSQNAQAVCFIQNFICRAELPLVIDADALNALAGKFPLLKKSPAPAILTPHPGEMARLTGKTIQEVQEDREGTVGAAAAESGKIVVLKGYRTLIAHPDGRMAVNQGGNSGMASGGTGDTLSGMLGSLLAQGLEAWDAARLGVFAHALAGDLAAKQMTERGMIARDLCRALPETWRSLESAKMSAAG